jgi:hypothetical protein
MGAGHIHAWEDEKNKQDSIGKTKGRGQKGDNGPNWKRYLAEKKYKYYNT